MKYLSKFLKLRRQYDIVKIMSFLFLLGAVMFGNAVFQGVSIYRDISKPVEYVLMNGASQNITDSQLKEIVDIDYVENVSIQNNASLFINNSEEAIECYEISKSYLKDVYQIESKGAMRTFYLTPKAYEKIRNRNKQSKATKKGNEELKLKYMLDDSESGIAKFVVLDCELFSDEVCAFCVGSSASLAKDSSEIRVYVSKKDLEGMTIKHLQDLGYGIENMEAVWETETERKIQFLKMKYDVGICVLCFGVVIVVWGMVKRMKQRDKYIS